MSTCTESGRSHKTPYGRPLLARERHGGDFLKAAVGGQFSAEGAHPDWPFSQRSPDEVKRNPGPFRSPPPPDSTTFHPGYACCSTAPAKKVSTNPMPL